MTEDKGMDEKFSVLSRVQLSVDEKAEIWAELEASLDDGKPAPVKRRAYRNWMMGLGSAAAVIAMAWGAWAMYGSTLHTVNFGTPVVHRAPKLFQMAVFDTDPATYTGGNKLYTISAKEPDLSSTSSHLLATNATWAKFSPDGKWVAVAIYHPASTIGQTSLWLISSDGTQKVKVLDANFRFGDWIPGTERFVYGTTQGQKLYLVQPNEKSQPYGVAAANNSQITDIRFSPNGKRLALVMSVDPPTRNNSAAGKWHDQVQIRDLATGKQTTLANSKSPDGYVLGPWSADSQSVFYWLDPQHAGSIMADGTQLMQGNLNGHSTSVAVTLADGHVQAADVIARTVSPFGRGSAAVQVGGRREAYMTKAIKLYQNGKLRDIPGQPNHVELSPVVTDDGAMIAFTAAPALKTDVTSESAYNAWLRQSTLNIYRTASDQVSIVQQAGTGIQTPTFTGDGKHVAYIKGNAVWTIGTAANEKPVKLAEFPSGTLELEDVQK
ncbi:WD40 repeat domain-containing protein [Alicyclobacillus dauci]|uniref:WD40 repeat domain-containing protein n=1 Tax=Alicyclobacillus dauci TaxID=1475485 RepID=A0ABY6Z669_9BACL|nr:WD40 repeat domain-containing protein [Alicyclobacillus dauci]WAH37769.1 WD40 repeat domain-containing protein [Alicyclobacillus dauci]